MIVRRAAVVDIGTNSILYLLAEKNKKGWIRGVFQQTETARLGARLDATGRIQKSQLDKAIRVLVRYRKLAETQLAEKVTVVGTHLFRRAANRDEILLAISNRAKTTVEVLSEQEEAEWSYRGALYQRGIQGAVVAVDIGGGSTEAVLGLSGRILEARSVPLGAVSLTERFLSEGRQADPPAGDEMDALKTFVRTAVQKGLSPLLAKGRQLVAIGGTATTLAALDLGLKQYDPQKADGTVIHRETVIRLLNELAGMAPGERKKRLSMDPKRADIITAGTVILNRIMESGSFDEALVSDRGLRFGIALREFGSVDQ